MAHALGKHDGTNEVTIFLMADAVLAAKARQKTPEGFYNVERMLKGVVRRGARWLAVSYRAQRKVLTEINVERAAQVVSLNEIDSNQRRLMRCERVMVLSSREQRP